jgi:hypothetical protein
MNNRPDILTSNAKLETCVRDRVLALGFQGLPMNEAKRGNACPDAGLCAKFCISKTGRGVFDTVRESRRRRHRFLIGAGGLPTSEGMVAMHEDLDALACRADAEGLTPAARLNVETDYDWPTLSPSLFRSWAASPLRFYDYTKSHARWQRFLRGELPPNYSLAFSVSERGPSLRDCLGHVSRRRGARPVWLAVVLPEPLHAQMVGREAVVGRRRLPIVDGDVTDAFWRRPDAERGAVLALAAKGAGGSRPAEPRTEFEAVPSRWLQAVAR